MPGALAGVDLNVVPINVHAFMRPVPLGGLFALLSNDGVQDRMLMDSAELERRPTATRRESRQPAARRGPAPRPRQRHAGKQAHSHR